VGESLQAYCGHQQRQQWRCERSTSTRRRSSMYELTASVLSSGIVPFIHRKSRLSCKSNLQVRSILSVPLFHAFLVLLLPVIMCRINDFPLRLQVAHGGVSSNGALKSAVFIFSKKKSAVFSAHKCGLG
jgi:hypothetical protein